MLLVAAPGLEERVDQRQAVHLPVILVKRPDHRTSVPPGPGRVVSPRSRLAGDRVHRSWGWRVSAALTGRLLAGLKPQREITRLCAAGEMPGNLDSVQKPLPRQQFVRVGTQRCRARVVGEHVLQELRDSGHLHALTIEKPKRRQPVAGLVPPGRSWTPPTSRYPGPLCRALPSIPSARAAVTDDRDDSRTRPPHAVTLTRSRSLDKPHSHYPLTSRRPQNVPHYFGQRDIRCPALRPDPAQQPRLEAILTNLRDRKIEAETQGWRGEAAMRELSARHRVTQLGRPDFGSVTGRATTGKILWYPA
jgi:hypothetical protein